MNAKSKELKQYHEKQNPVLLTERFLLVKINEDDREIRTLLAQKGIDFEDLVIQSIPDI
jgi:hypothetical protein